MRPTWSVLHPVGAAILAGALLFAIGALHIHKTHAVKRVSVQQTEVVER